MPTITLNKNVFEKLVGKKLPIEQLKNRIDMLGTGLEKIEGNEIHVEIFPNRPDLLSEQGFARAFSSFIGVKTGLKQYKTTKSGKKVIIDKSAEQVRPFTACAIVSNLKFDDEKIREVIQIQEKLHVTYGRNRKRVAIGIYPSEKITYPITFKALKPEQIKFRPLEALKELTAKQILENHTTGKEFAHLLKDAKVYPIFVDANNQVLSMPPIINSHDIGRVTEKTKEVFIECSGFDYRVLAKCLNMIVTALADMGGQIQTMELEYGKKKIVSPDLKPEEMKVDFAYINKRLGLNIKESEFKKLFEKMGYSYKAKKVLIPAYRTDILHQADLAEDIAIAYGYENIKPEIPKVATTASESKQYLFTKKLADIFTGLGFLETSTFHLIDKETETRLMNIKTDLIALENSVSEEYMYLRKSMLPSLIKVLSNNKHHELPQKIFEAGTTFEKDVKQETGIKETRKLACAIINTQTNYTDAKQVLDAILSAINIEYTIKASEHASFIAGRAGDIIVKGKVIGFLGEVSPQVLTNFKLNNPVAAFEINLDELIRAFTSK